MRLLGNKELARKWYLIVDHVDRSLVHGAGSLTSHSLFLECMQGNGQCWLREDEFGMILGVAITRFEMSVNHKVLAICATTDNDWFSHGNDSHNLLEQFAKRCNCQRMAVYGRKGWTKVLKRFGYYEPYSVMIKDLEV
jgi:hypothetical protein